MIGELGDLLSDLLSGLLITGWAEGPAGRRALMNWSSEFGIRGGRGWRGSVETSVRLDSGDVCVGFCSLLLLRLLLLLVVLPNASALRP